MIHKICYMPRNVTDKTEKMNNFSYVPDDANSFRDLVKLPNHLNSQRKRKKDDTDVTEPRKAAI